MTKIQLRPILIQPPPKTNMPRFGSPNWIFLAAFIFSLYVKKLFLLTRIWLLRNLYQKFITIKSHNKNCFLFFLLFYTRFFRPTNFYWFLRVVLHLNYCRCRCFKMFCFLFNLENAIDLKVLTINFATAKRFEHWPKIKKMSIKIVCLTFVYHISSKVEICKV